MQIEVTDPSFNLASYSEVDGNGDPLYGSIPFQIVVGNVGDAKVKGFDIDFKALIGDNMEFGFNLTDIRDAYVEAPEFYDEPRAAGQDRSHRVLIRSRHYHYSLIAVIRCISSTLG